MVRQVDGDTIADFTSEGSTYQIDKEVFKVDTALVVYKSNKGAQYMEKINFKADPRDNSMVAVGASPVRMKDIYAMREALNAIKEKPTKEGKNPMEEMNFEGIFPRHVLYWARGDYRKIIWTMDPEFLRIEMGYNEGVYNIPMDRILFATNGVAIKGFLTPKIKAFGEHDALDQLPLPNFYSSNNMCNGNTKLGTYNTMEQYLQAWENRVFNTKYSNENMGIGGIDGLKKLNGKKRLPKKYRAESDVTVNKLIEWLTT
jgi:hypothetical protein